VFGSVILNPWCVCVWYDGLGTSTQPFGFDDRFQAESGLLTQLGSGHQKLAWNLPVPNLQWKTPDDGQRRCPKHVEFYNKINFG